LGNRSVSSHGVHGVSNIRHDFFKRAWLGGYSASKWNYGHDLFSFSPDHGA